MPLSLKSRFQEESRTAAIVLDRPDLQDITHGGQMTPWERTFTVIEPIDTHDRFFP